MIFALGGCVATCAAQRLEAERGSALPEQTVRSIW